MTARAPDPAGSSRLGLYVGNLILLLLLGVSVSGYVLYFTSWFPVFGGLLGLGGLFAWVGFVSGMLKDSRKEALQDAFERAVLLSRWTVVCLLVVAAALLLGAAHLGSLRLESAGDAHDRVVTITAEGGAPVRFRLSAHADGVRVLPTGLLGTRTYRVKVSGLPHLVAPIRALRRLDLSVPSSFLGRPVLLVRPVVNLSATLANAEEPYSLSVALNGVPGPAPLQPYRGGTVWIGADDDTDLPDTAAKRWRLELIGTGASEAALTRWEAPQSVEPPALPRPGDLVQVRVLNPDGSELVATRVRVETPGRSGDFFQEVKLDVPH